VAFVVALMLDTERPGTGTTVLQSRYCPGLCPGWSPGQLAVPDGPVDGAGVADAVAAGAAAEGVADGEWVVAGAGTEGAGVAVGVAVGVGSGATVAAALEAVGEGSGAGTADAVVAAAVASGDGVAAWAGPRIVSIHCCGMQPVSVPRVSAAGSGRSLVTKNMAPVADLETAT
jgi:hypothetical protein